MESDVVEELDDTRAEFLTRASRALHTVFDHGLDDTGPGELGGFVKANHGTEKEQLDTERRLFEVDFDRWVLRTSDQGQQLRAEDADILDVHYGSQYRAPLDMKRHVEFLTRAAYGTLSADYVALDASQPWLCYWILHALNLLGQLDETENESDKIKKAKRAFVARLTQCRALGGRGFGGGPGQMPHVAPTFAALCALVTIGDEQALGIIDRRAIYTWLVTLKNTQTGAFRVCAYGEEDVRATYCALAVARLLNILDDALAKGCEDFISSLVSFDGGMGGEPGNEAHGGYTYCALAARCLLGSSLPSGSDTESSQFMRLAHWTASRHAEMEGGFSGRTNKLVDSCYAFWLGACCPILGVPFCGDSLERYVLNYGQDETGGLRDKPFMYPDFYHTCYALSGLSIAQHYGYHRARHADSQAHVAQLKKTHPVINVSIDKLEAAWLYFHGRPLTPSDFGGRYFTL
ncbi:Protein farnesyltransferase subunit beta [Porphyridium purpureum]|uniref:Protein farnesyltransferase subunit beta n=1 Tax=Porphyridium purpureum TaxID=35688 RepID=A0A5J4YNI1_PORPP|nr:Protein farnesyltransferase subunit beta [Porphyridium purpureum]|eukprot:POR9481..scf249_10